MVLTTADVKKYAISIQKSIKDPRKRALKQLEIAKRYREANNLEEAQECAKEYLKVNPSDHRAYNTLGLINEDLKQWEDALKFYKRSVELQRTQKDILIKVVEMYSKVPLKEPQIAKVWADKAEVISPNHPAIFNLRWHLLMSTSNKDYEEIEDLLAHELVRNPRDAKLHVKLLELYMEKDDMEEAYTHCKSVLSSRVFQSDQDWLMCAADVFEKYHQISNDDVEAAESFMKYVEVLCSLMDILLKTSSVYVVKDIFQRLDKVVGEAYIMPATSLPEHVQSEIEVFQAEARGQIYFHLSTVLFKMAQESELSWRNASRLACACLAASSLVKEPNTKVAWMQKKSPPDNIKMNWHTMACVRLSQTDHMILSMENEQSEEWIKGCVTDICSEVGKQDLIKAIYEESRPSSKSFLSMDKEFMTLEFELPDVNDVLKYDEVAFKENPNNLSLLVWVGINWHIMDDYLRTEVLGLYGQLFRELQPDVKDLKNCSPFNLSTMDLEVFIQAVVYSAVDKVTFDDKENKEEFEPLLLPLAISPKLDTNTQFDLWDSAYRLHTGKTWQASTSKLKSVLQHGLEVLRLIGNHGIDPRILKHIADLLLSKASDIIDNRPNEWRNQIQLESLKRRGFYFGDEALRILEISKSDRDVVQPKGPLIPPLLETIDDDERTELIDNLRMTLADAAFQDNSHDAALHYLSGLFTADSAYKEAQIYRDLASKENHTNVEGLRNHLSFLRKSREKLQTCLGLLEKSQAVFRTGIEAEIEEIREAISEQSGITAAPSKLLELRYSSTEEEEDDPENIVDVDQIQDESVIESKLALENSILHEQLAVRNHEFSVLASRIHNLEREMAEMRANQSASESIIKPRQDSSVNTDESSSSIAYVPKDDITSGSGNLTPRLEPEMSWDPFSPAPVAPAFPANFFAGLVDSAHTIAEETEHELLEANDSVDAKVEGSSAAVDTSQGEGGHSREEADHSHGDGIHVEPVVFLTKKADHTTGEENETVMFKEKAKLYRLNEGQWKERGVGEIKILMNPKTSKSRLLMRREQVFRLCANHLITQEMKMEQKQDSGKTFIWYTNADMSEEAPTAETFAVKFKNEQIAGAFASKFKECQEALKTPNDTKEEPEVAALSSRDETKPPSQSKQVDAHVTSDVESINPLLKASSLQQPTQEAPTFSFKLGGDAAAKPDDGEKLASTFAAATAQQTEGIQPAQSTVKFDFNPQATSGFPFGASKLNFDFGSVAHQPPEDDKAKENPFLAALEKKPTSSNIVNPFSFTSPGDSSQSAQDLPSFGLQGSPFASTPVLPSSFQLPNANRSLATAPQNARPFMAVASFSPQQFPNFSPQQLPNFSSQRLPNFSSQRLPNFSSQQQLQTRMGSPNAMHNAALHGPNMGYDQSQGYGLNNQLSNQNMEQARYFQEADWEERQDRYYEDAAYDDNDYYDDSTYYENGDYYDDGEFYTAEDGNSDQEAAAYYANEEDEFEYYDQEPTGPQIATADSDANSDRLSPQNEAVDSADIVPHVVQMIDDDIFVTYVKKATFAQRAKAARLQLPPNFFSPSSHPPCAGCQGCEDNMRVVIPADSPERSTATSGSKIPDAKMNIAVAKTDQIPVFPVVSKDRGQAEDKNPFLSFSDIVSNKSSQGFQGTPKGFAGFAGAGAQLFSSPKDNEDPEAYDPQYKPIIELEKKDDLKTGEEGYVDLFKSRAKLYRFDHEGKQWKERGVGEMKLSHNPETSYCRVLMRRDQVRKLCANHPTMPNIRLKPHGLSTTSWIWVSGADYADGEPKVEQFAIKFKNKELADEFKRVFEECQRTIVTYLQANGLSNEGEALKGDIEPKRVASKPGDPMQGGTVEPTKKDDTTTDQQVAFPPANSQATDKKESNESIKVSKDSIRLKFAPAVGSWECPTCMIVNKEAVMQCVSCTTAKPGTDPKPKSAPLFGQPTAKQGTDPEPKGAPLFGQSTGNASLFGQQSNKTQMFGQAASSGFVFGKSNSASPFAGFSLTPKNAEESGTKEKTVEGAGKQESSIRMKFAPETGSWECDACMVVNKPEVSECVACCTAKPGSDPKPSKPPIFGQQSNKTQMFGQAASSGFVFGKSNSGSPFAGFSLTPKNAEESGTKDKTVEGAGKQESSIRMKFAPETGSWECDTCMVVNKPEVSECVACCTAKPGSDPKPSKPPTFGQQSNKTQMFGQAASSGFVFGKSNSTSPFAGFSLTPKNAEESGTKEKTVEGAGKQESSIRLKFAPETGSWECDVCMVVNKPEVSECVACCTAKPGSDPKPSKPPFFGQKPSNEPLFGNQPNSAQVFGQAPGSGFMFGKTSSNSPFVGFSLKPKNEDKSVDPTKENTTQSTPGLNAESKTSSAEFSKTEPNEKVAGMKAPLFGQNNKNGFQFGTPSGSSAGGLFGSSAASFAQPAFSTPSFGLGLLSNDKKDTKANGSGSWECPTCLISNNLKSECCRSCKTENPTFLKDKTSPIIALKRSPLAENTDIKSMFAPKPGSWECPVCAIVNNKETLCCPACTTERPDSGQNINNKDSPAITSKPLFNFKQSELDSSLPKPFIFGQSSQDSKTTDFSFYATPTDTRQSQGGHNETTQFFTPTGTFSPAPFSFGKQPPSDVPPQKSQDGPQTPESPTKADDHSLHFDPLVSLKKIDVHKTGEENEEAMFCGKAKLYRFDGETKAWKERGVGELKILRNLEKAGRYRLVMRREQIRKLCANHSLVKGMSLKPMANSEKARIWSTAADYAEEETRGETFAVRFRTLELVKKFELMFNEGISENEKVEGNEGVIGQGKQETTSVGGSAFKIVDEENTQATESQLGKENEEKIIEAEKETYDIKFTKEILPSVNDQNKAEKLLLPKEFFNILSQGKEEQNAKESVSSSAPKVGAFSFNSKPVIFETFVTPRAPASEDSAAVQSPKAPASPEKFNEEECKATFTPIVQLERKEAGTGEESEGILFCQKAKVYRFDKNGPQWKERGVGQLKILKNKENGSVRIVMRRDQVKKICLNHFILPDMKLSPFENAKNAVIWFTPADFADESPQEEKFAAKFKSEEICKQFKDCFDSIANVGNGDHAKGDETATNSGDKVEDIGSSLVSNADQDTTVTSSVPSSNSQDVLPKQTPPSSGKGSQPLFSFGSTIASSRADTTVEDSTRSAQSKEGFGQFSWPVKLDSDKGLFSFGAADATLNDSKTGDKVQGTGTETSQPTKDSGLFSWPVNLQGSNNALSFGVSETNKEQDTSLTSIAESQQQNPEFTTKVEASKPFSFMWTEKEAIKGPFSFMWTDKEAIKGPFSFFSSGKAVEEIDGEAHQKEQTQDSASPFGLNAMQGSERATSSCEVDSKSSKGIEEVKKERDEETAASPARQPEDDECKAEFKALVSLNEVSHISGEENEEVLFNETAKAYRLDNDVKQWKERGKGDLKILKNRQSGQHRIIMRREQVKKIIINHAFIADMELKPFASKKNSWVWSTHADFADEVPKPEHLCVRFRNQEISDRFQTIFDGIIWMMNCEPEAVSVPESSTKEGDSGVHLDSQSLINAGLTATSSQIGVEELVPSTDSQETPAVEAHVPKDIEQSPVQRKSEVSSVSKVNEDVSVSTNDDSTEDDVLITFIKEPLEVEREKASRLLLPLTFYAASNEIPRRHRDSTPSPTAAMNENKDLQVGIEKEKNIDTNTSHFGFASSSSTGLSFSDLLSNSGGDFTAFKSSPQQTFKGQGAALFQSPNEKDGNDDYEAQVNFKPIVSLAKTEIKTGEEDEIALFTSRCKLYRLDGQWKERGVGELKILNNTNQGTFRIIMRRDVVRKLGANHLLHPGMEVVPKEGVETTWIWKCSADIADGEPHAQTFAAKFKNATIGRSFKESFEQSVRDSGQQVNAGSDHQKVEEETSATPTENIYEVPGNSSQFLEGSFVQSKEEVQSDQTGVISNDKASDQAAAAEPKLFGSSFSGLNFSNIATTGENAFKSNQRGGFANAGAQLFGSATGEGGEGREHDPHFEPIVQLQQVEVKSGEEDEDLLFAERAKMYRLHKESNAWKERGVGVLKLLRHKVTGKSRLLMRRDIIYKLAANHALTEDMKLEKMELSQRSLMWRTMAEMSDGEPEEALLAAKFRSEDMVSQFREVFEFLCSQKELIDKKVSDEVDEMPHLLVGSCSPAINDALQNFLDDKET